MSTANDQSRAETDLAVELRRYLQASRDRLVSVLDGLDEHDVRRPLTPTGTNLPSGHLLPRAGRASDTIPVENGAPHHRPRQGDLAALSEPGPRWGAFGGLRGKGAALSAISTVASPIGFTEWDKDHGILDVIPTPSGNISYVVDPQRRRSGYAVAMLNALWRLPQVSLVRLMVAGIEPANVASARTLLKAGYQPLHADPDWEGIVYYTKLRTLRTQPG